MAVVKWHGHIIKIYKYGFKAILKELDVAGTDELGIFSIDEVPKEDRYLISMGACFYATLSVFESVPDGFKIELIKS